MNAGGTSISTCKVVARLPDERFPDGTIDLLLYLRQSLLSGESLELQLVVADRGDCVGIFRSIESRNGFSQPAPGYEQYLTPD
jgi:hypothetical protein